MNRQVDSRKQFSKKLAGRAEWFWFVYMVLMGVQCVLRPEAAMAAVYLSILVTAVMVTSVLAYTKNSLYEKGLWAANEMAKIKFSWRGNGTTVSAGKTDEDDTDEDSDEDDEFSDGDDENDEGEAING